MELRNLRAGIGASVDEMAAWSALAELRKRKVGVGPAMKLAFEVLWIEYLGGRAGYVNITMNELALACGCDSRAGRKWVDGLIAAGLVEKVDDRDGVWRLYVPDPREADEPRRVDGDPQQTLFDDEAPPPVEPMSPTVAVSYKPATAPAAATPDLCAHKGPALGLAGQLSVQKGPDLCAPKGPAETAELAAIERALAQRRQGLGLRAGPEPKRLLGGPLGAQRSDPLPHDQLQLTAVKKDLITNSCQLAQTSAAAAVLKHHELRELHVTRICEQVPGLFRCVARAVVDGVMAKIFPMSDVDDALARSKKADVPWQYFQSAAKKLYERARAPWPNVRKDGRR